jgi:hypothetical protein
MTLRACSLLACAGLTSAALAQLPQPIFTTFQEQANSQVPGQPGFRFKPGTSDLGGSIFEKPTVSPDGQRFILHARRFVPILNAEGQTVNDDTRDGLVIVGKLTGNTPSASVIMIERDPLGATGALANETSGVIDEEFGLVNNGRFSYITLARRPGTGTSFISNRVVITGQLDASGLAVASWQVYARQGDPSPGVPGSTLGTGMFATAIADDGTPIWPSGNMAPSPGAGLFKQAIYVGQNPVAQTISGSNSTPLDPVTGLPFDSLNPYSSFLNAVALSADGGTAAWLANHGARRSVIVNGNVALLTGTYLPGDDPFSNFSISDLYYVRAANGRWISRGSLVDVDFAVSNAGVLRRSGQPLFPGTTELWERYFSDPNDVRTSSQTFRNATVNSLGEFVLSGTSNDPVVQRKAVMTSSNARLLLRGGDAADLNGDGQANDDAIFTGFLTDTATLADDGYVWFVANVNRPQASINAGTPVNGVGLFRLLARAPLACGSSDVAGAGQVIGADGQLTADDIIIFIGWFFADDARADIAGSGQSPGADGQFTADDIILFINRFFAGC